MAFSSTNNKINELRWREKRASEQERKRWKHSRFRNFNRSIRMCMVYPSCIVVMSNYNSHKYGVRPIHSVFYFELQHSWNPNQNENRILSTAASTAQRQDQYILLMVCSRDKSIPYYLLCKQTESLFSIDNRVHRMRREMKSKYKIQNSLSPRVIFALLAHIFIRKWKK